LKPEPGQKHNKINVASVSNHPASIPASIRFQIEAELKPESALPHKEKHNKIRAFNSGRGPRAGGFASPAIEAGTEAEGSLVLRASPPQRQVLTLSEHAHTSVRHAPDTSG
jgi:hypothetical protein